jgi:hypothetical protein
MVQPWKRGKRWYIKMMGELWKSWLSIRMMDEYEDDGWVWGWRVNFNDDGWVWGW